MAKAAPAPGSGLFRRPTHGVEPFVQVSLHTKNATSNCLGPVLARANTLSPLPPSSNRTSKCWQRERCALPPVRRRVPLLSARLVFPAVTPTGGRHSTSQDYGARWTSRRRLERIRGPYVLLARKVQLLS